MGFRVQGSGCRAQGLGCRVQGSGCRVQGFRVTWVGLKRRPRSVSRRLFSRSTSSPGPPETSTCFFKVSFLFSSVCFWERLRFSRRTSSPGPPARSCRREVFFQSVFFFSAFSFQPVFFLVAFLFPVSLFFFSVALAPPVHPVLTPDSFLPWSVCGFRDVWNFLKVAKGFKRTLVVHTKPRKKLQLVKSKLDTIHRKRSRLLGTSLIRNSPPP